MPISDKLIKEIEEGTYKEFQLKLNNQDITYKDIEKLVPAIKKNPHIKILSLHENQIGKKSAKLLATIDNIFELDVSYTNIRDEGAQYLFKSTIAYIDLGGNSITDKGLNGIESNNTLRQLDIYPSAITEKGIDLILKNKSLDTLHIKYSAIKDIEAVRQKLSTHHSLQKVIIEGGNLTFEKKKTEIPSSTATTSTTMASTSTTSSTTSASSPITFSFQAKQKKSSSRRKYKYKWVAKPKK
jgi:hypothetical protein